MNTYVDICAVLGRAHISSKNAAGEVFNIGTGKNVSVNQLAEVLKDMMNRKDLKKCTLIQSQPTFDTATPT